MNEHPDWTRQAKALLDESAQNIDAAAASRLNRARQAALRQRRARVTPAWFVSAGFASACMVLLAVAVWHGLAPRAAHETTPVVQIGESPSADADSGEDDEFFEDLDFYTWLEAQDQDSDDNG